MLQGLRAPLYTAKKRSPPWEERPRGRSNIRRVRDGTGGHWKQMDGDASQEMRAGPGPRPPCAGVRPVARDAAADWELRPPAAPATV
jgi:hypothetical protein